MHLLEAGTNPATADHYLWCTPDTVTWGTLPTPATPPVLKIDDGQTVTFDTVSQEGLMEDQGRDPVGYFGQFGVDRSHVLSDAIALADSDLRRGVKPPGPHIVLGPVQVRGAEPGDWLRVDFLELAPRVPYGVISSRHGRGCLPDQFPRLDDGSSPAVFSKFCSLNDSGTQARFDHGADRHPTLHGPVRCHPEQRNSAQHNPAGGIRREHRHPRDRARLVALPASSGAGRRVLSR
jgi:hypothetical protein